MTQEEFNRQAKEAAKKFSDKKTPTKPETQFLKGAQWAWEQLMAVRSAIYYEERLRRQVCDRLKISEPELWMEDLIETTAETLEDRDATRAEIIRTGRTWESYDKNMNPKKESCPHVAHLKDLLRTLAIYFESLGLSFKANPKKMAEPPKKGGSEQDKLQELLEDLH